MLQTNRLHIRDAAAEIDRSESIILRAAANSEIILYAHVTRCPVKEQLEPWSGEIQLTAVQAGTLAVSPSALVILTEIETEAGVLHPIDAPLHEQRAIIHRPNVLVDISDVLKRSGEPEVSATGRRNLEMTIACLVALICEQSAGSKYRKDDDTANIDAIAQRLNVLAEDSAGMAISSVSKRLTKASSLLQ